MYQTRFKSKIVASTGKLQIMEVRVWVPGAGDRVKLTKAGTLFWNAVSPAEQCKGTVESRTPYGCVVLWDNGSFQGVQFQDNELQPA